MPSVARYGFFVARFVFCGCFHLSIALLVVAFCWYEKPKRATKGKKSPNGNQALVSKIVLTFYMVLEVRWIAVENVVSLVSRAS